MTGHGQRQFFGGDSAAVIDHADQFQPALHHLNIDARRARIDGIFHQLLHHACRPFDDLAGGDFVDQRLREDADGHDWGKVVSG
jgi:hypothetical protein